MGALALSTADLRDICGEPRVEDLRLADWQTLDAVRAAS